MRKKVFKNVILALCVLALVFQPLTSFASDLTYDWSTFGRFVYPLEGSSYYPNHYLSDIDLAAFYDITGHYASTYSYLSSAAINISNAANMIFYKGSDNVYYLYAPDPSNFTLTLGYGNSGTALYFYNGISDTPTTCRFFSLTNLTTYRTSVSQYPQSQIVTMPLFISPDITTNTGVNIFTAIASSDYPDIPDLSGVNTSSPNSLYIPLFQSVFQTYAHKLYSEFPSYVSGSQDDGTLIYKTYETGALWYLLMTNCGIMETYFNHQYEFFNNISGNLASFANNQNEISEYVSSVIPSVEQIESELINISDKLDMAFPDDQADMNDAIADQILDDSNGNGLTINKISSAKSDLDDGLDTFKLDVSDSQYSNPFSALSDADWSFWSQTTLNNLGSGYSFEYSDAALMDDEDVFDVNQRTLLDLLGW